MTERATASGNPTPRNIMTEDDEVMTGPSALVEKPVGRTDRAISHEEAKQIAFRLIRGSFRRDGERLDYDKRPQFSIPCRPDHDDDCLILSYIEQQAALIDSPDTPSVKG